MGNPEDLRPSAAHIGPYRILRVLGEGGMGVVYLADQEAPVRREVALKVIKPGMDSREVLARFESERQALAILNHPHIARVFDAGATEDGRPYFVMEHVPGVPITNYCDTRRLGIPERLGLFLQACDAIQHAHQKGILHRDVKPSNVLVAEQDARPVVKVIDFGVAKATSRRLTERTLFTQDGLLIGTPEYMSPEQAGTTGLEMDSRTDIYSLGVLLYELLVGAVPFDPETLRRAAAREMLRIIQEDEPPKPTTRIGSLGDTAQEIARRRHTDLRSLVRQLHGDLEWITMRALEKDPARRYPSASELAADIRRHLDDEPVVAGPPGQLYRLRKLARRHRAASAAAGVSFAVLLAGVTVSTSLFVRSEAARRRAETEARRSRLEAEALQAVALDHPGRYRRVSREAMDSHRSVLGEDSPRLALYAVNRLVLLDLTEDSVLPANSDHRGQLEETRDALDLVNRALEHGDPDAAKAAALLTGLLPPDQAALLARRALPLARARLAEMNPETMETTERLVQSLETRAIRADAASDDEAFEQVYRESLERSRRMLPSGSPILVETERSLAAVLERKGSRLRRAGDASAAALAFREALDHLGAAGLGEPKRIAKLRSDLGASLMALGRLGEAEPLLLDAITALEKDWGRGRTDGSMQVARSRLANLYTAWKRPKDAARVRALLPGIFVEEVSEVGPVPFEETVMRRKGARSALLDGESVWVFGETTTSRPGSDGSALRQATLAWTDNLDASKGLTPLSELKDGAGVPVEALPLTNEDAAFNAAHSGEKCVEPCGAGWLLEPGAVVADGERDRLLVFYERVFRHGGNHNERVGASLAAWRRPGPSSERPTVRPEADSPRIHFGPEEPGWGSAALTVADHMYVYACEVPTWPASSTCRLARVPVAAALDRSQWRFFGAGGRWSNDWRDAQPVLQGGIESGILSVHWNPFLGKFMAVYSWNFSRRIAIRFADHPEGPWSEAGMIDIDTLPSGPGWDLTAGGLGHPEFAREGGRIEYVTYQRTLGRPEVRWMEVRFGRK